MGGVSSDMAKTATAASERVKLLIQNQDEMLKSGCLLEPYNGIGKWFSHTIRDEGFLSLCHSNGVNIICYFPTHVCSSSTSTRKKPTSTQKRPTLSEFLN